ncbi:hypothetical protein, membrane [gut metagenome]|uniref:Transmembrane protein n=1 Tax=gut metagenome TaxID=749906 RepID=J9GN49_9ZZZZ
METLKPKIKMFVKRSFGERMDASFDFIKENWKPFLMYCAYLLLPLCFIQGLALNGMVKAMTTMAALEVLETHGMAGTLYENGVLSLLSYLGLAVISLMVSLLYISLVFALLKLYNDREERLQGITLNLLKPVLLHNAKRLLFLGFSFFIVGFVWVIFLAFLLVLTPYTLLVTLPLSIALLVPLAMTLPVYLFEPISLWAAYKKAFRLGLATWGGTFLILLLMGLIATVLQGVVALPWYVISMVRVLFVESDSGSLPSPFVLNSVQYLFSVLMLFGSYLASVFNWVGLTYQYGHASEVVDSISVENDINNFDKL